MDTRKPAMVLCFIAAGASGVLAELNDRLGPPLDHPAIQYRSSASDPVAVLNQKLQSGSTRLQFEGQRGYLRSLLAALNVPIESQIAVFSKTSFQYERISPRNPRAIYFNDSVSVAWMFGGFIELAAQDPQRGIIFYTLSQEPSDLPTFERRDSCLSCHFSDHSLGVPGMMIRSLYTAPDGRPLLIFGGSSVVDHRTPLEERWGGYYVTGAAGAARHLGNAMFTEADENHPESAVTATTLKLDSLEGKFVTGNYLSPYSDATALLVFNHQMHMQNLLTRLGWEFRAAQYTQKGGQADGAATLSRDAAEEFVDYLLFIGEAPLAGAIASGPAAKLSSGFAAKFAAQGPRDAKGRSLRELDLRNRLLRYPCSYMIYSPAFDALPQDAKDAIYRRIWKVLTGAAREKKYAQLSLADRRAIVEILRDTKRGLPDYFR